MSSIKYRVLPAAIAAAGLVSAGAAFAGSKTFDFNSGSLPAGITVAGNGVNPGEYQATGGNPAGGGFLAVTWPIGGQATTVRFDSIDPVGQVVTAFNFKCDLRVGNSTGDRAADGFSLSFARDGDPILDDANQGNQGLFAGGIAEGGATTGIAVSFDTWSGNTLPDGGDIEGIIVRVDNKTVNRTSLPTRHGACDDATSLQTGPRNADFWAGGGDPQAPESWAQLCWKPFEVDLTEDGKLTVSWKGRKILDKFASSYFPTAGQIVFAGRTGGANEHGHVDNIVITTKTATVCGPPAAVPNFKVAEAGATRVKLAWDAATIACDPTGRVAYEIDRDGVTIARNATGTEYQDFTVSPSKTYAYKIRGKNIAAQAGPDASVSATTVALVDSIGFLMGKVYDGIGGTAVDGLYGDEDFPANPNRIIYSNGLSFGEPNFGGTLGDNFGILIEGVLTASESGSFRFFTRSDDASAFYLNTAGPAIPNPVSDAPIAQELGCCTAFLEPPDEQTSEPIALTAGREYGFAYVVKEGGGGDWGQIAMRKEGDTTAAGALRWIQGAIVKGKADGVGAVVNITTPPADQSVAAYKSATFSVTAETASPYTSAVVYQWYKNGAIVPGASGRTYAIAQAQPADSGAKYKALVAVPGKSVTSAEATLTVTDSVPATVASVAGSDSFTTATVKFDQPVTAPSAATAANYAFDGGLTVSAAQTVDDFTVKLTTSKQTEGGSYKLTVSNVQNKGGKPVAAGTGGTLKSWVFTPGKAKIEIWNGVGGVAISALTDLPSYPNSPDETRVLDEYLSPINFRDNFGAVVSTYVVVPENGNYVFFLSADDNAEMYLSTDENPANAKLIGREPEWNGERQWVITDRRGDPPANRSDRFAETQWAGGATITLVANKRYFSKVIYKEGGGGDSGGVAIKKATDPDPSNGSPATKLIGAFAPQAAAPAKDTLAAALTGGNVVISGFTGTLESAPDPAAGPWTTVPEAVPPSYSTPATGAPRYFRSRN